MAPTSNMVLAVAAKLNGVVMISSPGPILCASNARCSAAVPEETATASSTEHNSAKRRSKAATRSPCANCPDVSTSRTASFSSSPNRGRAIEIIVIFLHTSYFTLRKPPGLYHPRSLSLCPTLYTFFLQIHCGRPRRAIV